MFNEWTEEQKEELINGFWTGLFTIYKLPVFLYDFTLTNYVGAFTEAEAVNYLNTYLNELQYMAADKTASQMLDFQRLLIQNGSRITRAEFLEVAIKLDDKYNIQYLATEYNTTIAQAQSVRDWNNFDKKLLKYRTVEDPNVRHSHAELNGIIRPKDDPFWNTYAPLNGWNCRCYLQELDAGNITDVEKLDKKSINEGVPSEFRNNPATSGKLWKGGNVYSDQITKRQKKSVEKLVNG